MKANCKYCGKQFDINRKHKKYCCAQCATLANTANHREYMRHWLYTPQAHKKQLKRHRDHRLARQLYCERCGIAEKRLQLHHVDYTQYDGAVFTLCSACHSLLHHAQQLKVMIIKHLWRKQNSMVHYIQFLCDRDLDLCAKYNINNRLYRVIRITNKNGYILNTAVEEHIYNEQCF